MGKLIFCSSWRVACFKTNTLIQKLSHSRTIIKLVSISCAINVSAAAANNNTLLQSGPYVGIHFGETWNNTQLNANYYNFISNSNGFYSKPVSGDSALVGLQIGYLKNLMNTWLVGAEADFTYVHAVSNFSSINGYSNYDQFLLKNKTGGSLRLRSGNVVNDFFPFVTAGISISNLSLDYNNDIGGNYSINPIKLGFIVGCGLEHSLTKNFSGRVEYLHTDYGHSLNLYIPDSYGSPGYALANLYTNVLRVAINYRV